MKSDAGAEDMPMGPLWQYFNMKPIMKDEFHMDKFESNLQETREESVEVQEYFNEGKKLKA
jgi:hypothetical protein